MACPYRYFLKYILAIEPLDEYAEDTTRWLDPLTYGSLLHDLLYDFMQELKERNEQDDAPWVRERKLIEELPLPLNLDGNKSNPFAATVSRLRHSAREVARQLPVMPNK